MTPIDLGRAIIAQSSPKATLWRRAPGSALLIGYALRVLRLVEYLGAELDEYNVDSHRVAVFLAVSCGDDQGQHEPKHLTFLDLVAAAGGIAIRATSVADVLTALED